MLFTRILIILFFCTNLYAGDFQSALDSSCVIITPINQQTMEGTGCVFKEDELHYYVLTCGHNITKDYCKLRFTKDGEYIEIDASRYYRYVKNPDRFNPSYEDYGILYFFKKAAEEQGLKINPIPISLEKPDINGRYYSTCRVGDQNGRVALCEHKTKLIEPDSLMVTPLPFPGTSGSSIFNEDFSKIYGIHIASNGLCARTTFIARHYEQSTGKSLTQD